MASRIHQGRSQSTAKVSRVGPRGAAQKEEAEGHADLPPRFPENGAYGAFVLNE